MGSTVIVALIEDRTDNAEVLRILLASESGVSDVPWFKTGDEFLSRFEPGAYDLILLDIELPGMDGYAVLREIRKKDRKVPVIALTAYAYATDRDRAFREGFTDFVSKPIVDFDAFRRIISHHTNGKENQASA